MARTVLHAPGVRTARKAAERAVTPYARIELAQKAEEIAQLRAAVADLEASMPAVLNAISSMNGATRLVKRELDTVRELAEGSNQKHASDIDDLQHQVRDGDHAVLSEMRPHIDMLAWLIQRVETVRLEMLNELRYGQRQNTSTTFEPRIVNAEALCATPLRLNIGAGHIPLDGYVNVDMRELPGIDVVATVDALPLEPGTVDEIYSSHTLEHFPHEVLRRQLLPYWSSLLRPGGTIRTVAPDLEAMSADFVRGDTPFDDYREVLYGGQEYEGDTHYTGFTPASFVQLLLEAGFVEPVTMAHDRQNGLCKEFEVTARKAG
jgi:hypothetical protein